MWNQVNSILLSNSLILRSNTVFSGTLDGLIQNLPVADDIYVLMASGFPLVGVQW